MFKKLQEWSASMRFKSLLHTIDPAYSNQFSFSLNYLSYKLFPLLYRIIPLGLYTPRAYTIDRFVFFNSPRRVLLSRSVIWRARYGCCQLKKIVQDYPPGQRWTCKAAGRPIVVIIAGRVNPVFREMYPPSPTIHNERRQQQAAEQKYERPSMYHSICFRPPGHGYLQFLLSSCLFLSGWWVITGFFAFFRHKKCFWASFGRKASYKIIAFKMCTRLITGDLPINGVKCPGKSRMLDWRYSNPCLLRTSLLVLTRSEVHTIFVRLLLGILATCPTHRILPAFATFWILKSPRSWVS